MSSHKRTFTRQLVIGIIGLSFVITLGLAGYYWAKSNPLKQDEDSDPKPALRASYHFTTPDKWKNDPQRPIYYDGAYHYYYLYNGDYPSGNGTEWRHATSTDLVYWKDEGIAIPKYSNPNGDVWSGSVVVDEAGTSGFGKGALVAIVTQPSAEGENKSSIYGIALTGENHLRLTATLLFCRIRGLLILETRKSCGMSIPANGS